jgi:hypothetical protein
LLAPLDSSSPLLPQASRGFALLPTPTIARLLEMGASL